MTSFEARFCECFHKDLPPPLPRKPKRSTKRRRKRNAAETAARKGNQETSNGLLPLASDPLPPALWALLASETPATSIGPPKTAGGTTLASAKEEELQPNRAEKDGEDCVQEGLRGEPDGQDSNHDTVGKGDSKGTLKASKEKEREGVGKSVSNAESVGRRVDTANGPVRKSAGSSEIASKANQEQAFENADNKINENIVNKLEDETLTNAVEKDGPRNAFGGSVGTRRDAQELPPPKELLGKPPQGSRGGKDRPKKAGGPVHQRGSQRNQEAVGDAVKGAGRNQCNEVRAENQKSEDPPATVSSTSKESLAKKNAKKHSDSEKSTLPNGTDKKGEQLETSPKRHSTHTTKYRRREATPADFGTSYKTKIPVAKPSFQLSIKTPLGTLEVSRAKGSCKTHQQGYHDPQQTNGRPPTSRGRRSFNPTVEDQGIAQHNGARGYRRKGKDSEVNQDSIPCILIGDSPSTEKKEKPLDKENEVILLSPNTKPSAQSKK